MSRLASDALPLLGLGRVPLVGECDHADFPADTSGIVGPVTPYATFFVFHGKVRNA